ncbi:MAG TPA: serine hydrolase domain-containing protein [Nevskiaceae bacterium]|nr:serine hydrolase domain-containing protein [Nevskiaceae bacterium]
MTEAKTPTIAEKLDELFKPWNRSDAPGCVVGVAREGSVLYRRAFGLASIEHARANAPSVRMRIGSTTKHFCALGILLLREDGKLDIDAPVRTYLPELANIAGEPTLRQLMHHTGGVRDPVASMFFLNRGTFGHAPEGSGLQLMQRFSQCNFAPGEHSAYSNAGYYLLSLVIERISGQTLETYFRQRLFQPLGMHATELLRSDMAIVPNIASFHVPQADGSWRRGIYPTDEILGSGGLISTVDDMLAWAAHLRGPQRIVGNAQTWQLMLERPRLAGGEPGDYCCGLARDNSRGVDLWSHAGATLGALCQMIVVPEHRIEVVVMSNRSDIPVPALAMKIAEGLLEGKLQPPRVPARAEDYAALSGNRWFSPASRTLLRADRMKLPAGEALMLYLNQTPAGLLFEKDGGLVRNAAAMDSLLIPQPPKGTDAPARMEVRIAGRSETFERLAQTPPGAAELAPQLVGRYCYTEFGSELAIALVDGKLCLDFLPHYGRAQWELEPQSENVLTGGIFHSVPPQPVPVASTVVVERESGKVRGVWLMSERFSNLWFERIS